MEFEDVNDSIYNALRCEFFDTNPNFRGAYQYFIINKNIGIEHVNNSIYKIVNKKKWLLAKIKYGF